MYYKDELINEPHPRKYYYKYSIRMGVTSWILYIRKLILYYKRCK